MTRGDHPSLREYVERIISENNLRRDDLRFEDNRRFDDSVKAVAAALNLKSAQDKEHFEGLNGEAGRIRAAIAVTVSRDTWDGHIKAYVEFTDRVNAFMSERAGMTRAGMIVIALATAISTCLSVVVAIAVLLK